MPLGWKGYIYFYNPDNEALYHVSYPLFSASITITAVRCQVKNTTGGGRGKEGRVKPITTAPSWLSKITFKETKVNTEPYGSILIQLAIILSVFLVVRDPQCIENIFSYILKTYFPIY